MHHAPFIALEAFDEWRQECVDLGDVALEAGQPLLELRSRSARAGRGIFVPVQ